MVYDIDDRRESIIGDSVRCYQCGSVFEQINKHWARSSTCSHPPLTDHQHEVVTGLLMGDGSMNIIDNRSPRIQVASSDREFLEHVAEAFPIYTGAVDLHRTAEEGAKDHRERGFNPNAKAENYRDIYRWRSRYTPALSEFSTWYDSGKKTFPANTELTPTVLKYWYVCDGHYDISGTAKHIDIGLSNEFENREKIEKMFSRIGFSISSWNVWKKSGDTHAKIRFTKDESIRIFDYMGQPIPPFEYKWPEEYRNT